MRALLLVHNLPDRGSYFRALEIGRRLALRGHYVHFAYVSNLKKFRPVYTAVAPAEAYSPPAENDPRSVRSPAQLPPPESGLNFVWAEMPYFTLFNDRQEGWGFFDNLARLRNAFTGKWDLVYGFTHKPNDALPALAAKLLGARAVLDWADWWGTSEGLLFRCALPSNNFQSMPGPLKLGRRLTFYGDSLLEKTVYRAADAVTLISDEFYKHPGAGRNLADKAWVMHSGAPLTQIVPQDKATSRQRIGLSLSQASIVLGYAANYHMDERLLMDAFAHVCDARDDVHLLIVGADLESTSPDVHHRTQGRVHHFGRQPFQRMSDFLGASDHLLLPLTDVALDRARYPHKLSDYVAAGRPVIACEVGATGRLMRKLGLGLLSAPTAIDFVAAILSACNQREHWNDWGQTTRQIAEKHFNWDALTDELFAFLSRKTGISI